VDRDGGSGGRHGGDRLRWWRNWDGIRARSSRRTEIEIEIEIEMKLRKRVYVIYDPLM
jgi:hypothetical protein